MKQLTPRAEFYQRKSSPESAINAVVANDTPKVFIQVAHESQSQKID